jgi:hypothetical protein
MRFTITPGRRQVFLVNRGAIRKRNFNVFEIKALFDFLEIKPGPVHDNP